MTDRSSEVDRLGVDIGGTSMRVVAFTPGLDAVAASVGPTPNSPTELVERLLTMLGSVAREAGALQLEQLEVGVGIPGQVLAGSGLVRHAVNLGIGAEGLDLAGALATSVGRVLVDNDVNAAALGLAHRLEDPAPDLALLSIGTGVAAGLVLGGRLHRGKTGLSGEVGHLPVDPDGPPCTCGQTGCLEAVASGTALDSAVGPGTSGADLLARVADAEASAVVAWSQLTRGIAWAAQMLVLTLDVDAVVLAGGVAEIGDPLLEAVRRETARAAESSGLLADAAVAERLQLAPTDVRLGALGAAALLDEPPD